MMLARVIGNVVATIKHEALAGHKLLLIQPIRRTREDHGRPLVAVDAVGAGFRETVYWCRGKEASLAFDGAEVPTDAAVVGIVDQITPSGTTPVQAGSGWPGRAGRPTGDTPVSHNAASPSRTNKNHKRGRR